MAHVFITGCSTGIGLATSLTLARAGHQVHATMRNPARAPQLAEAAAREKLPLTISAMDVDSDASVQDVLGKAVKNGSQVDVLVNNAGVERAGAITELPLEEFRRVMETNYFGALRCIQAAAPHMARRKSGCIVNVSSVSGRIASTPLAPYTASKWALEALSEALAQEMKPHNVRVALVQPGIIDTPMAQRIAEPETPSADGRVRRFSALFAESLKKPASPFLVAEKIREIVENGTQMLRHPVGPDAQPFLEWRAAMSDEEWIDWGAADDEAWYARVQRDFGLNVRPRN